MYLCIVFLPLIGSISALLFGRLIGQNGINIIRKVFGVILLAIAVKLFAHNIKALFELA